MRASKLPTSFRAFIKKMMLELVIELEKGSRDGRAMHLRPGVSTSRSSSPCTQHTRPPTATRVSVTQRMLRLIPEVWMELQDHFLISAADVCGDPCVSSTLGLQPLAFELLSSRSSSYLTTFYIVEQVTRLITFQLNS